MKKWQRESLSKGLVFNLSTLSSQEFDLGHVGFEEPAGDVHLMFGNFSLELGLEI